ncbi:hypothetical protein [Clostridium sp. AF22-10]|uniref:hypothetical protein n=1 Tax=Clostridium sp. AF22-10 TaxID=2293004 RepID=UPI000E5580D5|nr:hypothetical protein DWX91_15910 [Clostridium sp. AF22-10]
MKFENTKVYNFEGAIRGARNPLESWSKSDSIFDIPPQGKTILGKNDLGLMQRLIKAAVHDGHESHNKFMRQIMVCVDITAPMYWWSEFDTYKVGTVANSTSKMHKIHSTPITEDLFSFDHVTLCDIGKAFLNELEALRCKFNETKDKKYWYALIQLLPESFNQTRTVTMNYENIRNMYFQRRNHKLTEWSGSFIDWVKSLPYTEELIMYKGE